MTWATVTIGDSCDVIAGGTPKRSEPRYWDGDIPWVKISDMLQGRIAQTDESITQAGLDGSAAKLLPPGTLLVSIFATIGRTAVLHCEAATNQAIVGVIPKQPDQFDARFLEYSLQEKTAELERKARGVAQVNINGAMLKATEIPLPPLAEQKRIAGILDAADALRAKRRESLAQLDTLLQSIFLEMFGDPVTNPMGLPEETLKSAFEFTTGKLDSNAAVEGGKYPFFTCARETFAIDDYAFDCEALLLAGNNANADYSVKHYKGKFNAYQRTYVITVDESLLTYAYSQFVLEYLLSDLKRFSKGTNTKYLTMVILNRMPILVPPLDLQHRFAAIVESVEQQKASQRAHLEELDTLFASLQSRAFQGEL